MSRMIGVRCNFFSNAFAPLGVSYDKSQGLLFGPG